MMIETNKNYFTLKIRQATIFLFCIIMLIMPSNLTAQDTENYTFKLTQSTGSYEFWTTTPAERVFKDDNVPTETGSTVKVYAAKNEFEPFKVVVRPSSSGAVSVSIGSFGSGIISEIYQTKYVNIAQATDALGKTGDYPDPLWPIEDGSSVNVTAGENTAFWFNLYVPKTVTSGDYTANVTIGGVNIPVTLHVFNFAVPDDVHVKSQMNFSHQNILTKYSVPGTGVEYWMYVDKMKQYFIDHRLTPKSALWSGGLTSSGGAPYIDYDCGNHTFTDNDGIWGFEIPADKYLNGNGFNGGTGFPSFMAATFQNNDASQDQRPSSFCSQTKGATDWYTGNNPNTPYNTAWFDYIEAMEDYLSSEGYLDKAYYYFANEPQDQADYDAVAWYSKELKNVAPNLKLMISEEPKPEIYNTGDIDIWLPVLNNYDPTVSHDREKNHGEETWIYFLHGTRPPYFNPITLDHPGVESKFTGWFLWKYRLKGIAYYSMNNWSKNPWTDPLTDGHNGDLFMLYPPSETNSNIAYGSNNHRFVPSIRFELMRDGFEDYEYLYMLNGASQPVVDVANPSDTQADKIISGLTSYTRDSEFMYNLRRLIGLKIGGEIATIPDIQPESLHPRSQGAPGNYYVNFQNPVSDPSADPLIVGGNEYMKIGWNTYDETLGYGWYGDMAHVMYKYLTNAPNELQNSIIYDDWGREKVFEFDLPNGTYNVTVSVGWQGKTYSHNKIDVEGVSFVNDEATSPYIVRTKEVMINDHKLTMEMGIFDEYTMLNYIDIEAAVVTTPILSVTPSNQSVPKTTGSTSFTVSNTGVGTMNWTASANQTWLTITGGNSGTDGGTINVEYDANAGQPRTGTITVTATGAGGSPKTLQINQAGNYAPTVANPIANVSKTSGFGTYNIDLSNVFADADNDALSYSATSNTPGVATVSVVGSTLTITEVADGTSEITVTANDGNGGTIDDVFTITINATPPNNPPAVANAIADVVKDEGFITHTINLTNVFSDADSDPLTYSVVSNNTGIATVSVLGSTITVTEVATGSCQITVTANDGNGGSINEVFTFTINEVNTPPVVSNAIADVTLNESFGTHNIDLSNVFTDADADVLSYSAISINTNIATVSVTGQILKITEATTIGTCQIKVTANDNHGGTVNDIFNFTVKSTNNPPIVNDAISDVLVNKSFSSLEIDFSDVFTDNDGDNLTYSVVSSNENVATVSISGTKLTITENATGKSQITLTANDGNGGSIDLIFTITINNPPVVANEISDQTKIEGFGTFNVDFTDVFTDTDNDELVYAVSSSDENIATVAITGTSLKITEAGIGQCQITITANDGKEGSVSDEFTFTNKARPVITAITSVDGIYGIGKTVEVTINFDMPLTLSGGNLLMNLSNGKTINIGPFDSKNSISGSFVVAEGDAEVTNLSVESIKLKQGAALKNVENIDAKLAIPNGANLADRNNVDVDGIRPKVNESDIKYNPANFIYLPFNENVYRQDKKRGSNDLTANDIGVTQTGGTATLNGFSLIKHSDNLYYLALDLQGTPDGNESFTISIKNIFVDEAGNACIYYQDLQYDFAPIPIVLPPAVPLSSTGIVIVFLLIGLIAVLRLRLFSAK